MRMTSQLGSKDYLLAMAGSQTCVVRFSRRAAFSENDESRPHAYKQVDTATFDQPTAFHQEGPKESPVAA